MFMNIFNGLVKNPKDEIFLQELTVQKMNTVMTKREESKITIDINSFLEVPITFTKKRDSTNIKLSLQRKTMLHFLLYILIKYFP